MIPIMTTDATVRQHESTVNVALARALRDLHGVDAQAETIINGRRPDVLIERDAGLVIIESEFEPAISVDDDALAKLHLDVRGRSVGVTFALVLPEVLRNVHEAQLAEKLDSVQFKWRVWYSQSEVGPTESGSLGDLAASILAAEALSNDLDDAVACLDVGAKAAGATLYPSVGAMNSVAAVFDREVSDEVANMAGLMCINAFVFHERLRNVGAAGVPPMPKYDGVNFVVSPQYVDELVAAWTRIIDVDYRPIFDQPRRVLMSLEASIAVPFVRACRQTAREMSTFATSSGHDLAGQIFNRLVADRKFVAAYYTSIPAATLLAGLALAPEAWEDVDWADIASLKRFDVLDPACGTGTLLMAAYQQILHNHRSASRNFAGSDEGLHRTLVEDVIHGADILDAGIHVTASSLAASAPEATFRSMNLHVFPLGVDRESGGQPRVGSLEWLEPQPAWSMFSGAAQQVSPDGPQTRYQVPRPDADLVIANPPYRRHNSGTGEGDQSTRVFGHLGDFAGNTSQRLQSLQDGTPARLDAGLASSFMVLADHTLNGHGRLAFVLPMSALFGTSWTGIREMLASRYEVEWVITSHDGPRRSFSFDTAIGEALVVARKVANGKTPSGRARFLNLWRRPTSANEASAVTRRLHRAPEQLHRLDAPPVGATDLILGSDKWGEIVDAPVGPNSWHGARWHAAVLAQYGLSIARGELWNSYGSSLAGRVPVATLDDVAGLSHYDLQIKGTLGVFDIADGWDAAVRYPALRRVDSLEQRTLDGRPNARLSPKPGVDFAEVWGKASELQVKRDIRYTSQRIAASRTNVVALGVRSWYSLQLRDIPRESRKQYESALLLWMNSSLGLLCHANHANPSQLGRGQCPVTLLRSMPTLDVKQLSEWQLTAADKLYSDVRQTEFKPFYKCAVDKARIELDRRLVTEVLGLGEDAVQSVNAIRDLLAREPSIHGGKKPALP